MRSGRQRGEERASRASQPREASLSAQADGPDQATQVIARPVAEVFSVVVDAGEYACWNPTIKASRRMKEGEIDNRSRFEWKLRGFGTVIQELQEFQRTERVRIVPLTRTLAGGHRFLFSAEGERTHVDRELELIPKGVLRLSAPLMARSGRKNLRATAEALRGHLEARAGEGARG
jgi:Polyketide cyclase / dehydrase and lipid transport